MEGKQELYGTQVPIRGQRKNGEEEKSEEMDRDFYFNFLNFFKS